MRDYHINIFYSEEDEAYIADIPDLKYCSAAGDTPQEALQFDPLQAFHPKPCRDLQSVLQN